MSGFFAYHYVLALSLAVAVSSRLRRDSRIALGLAFAAILCGFTAFRYNFGYDYFNYEDIIKARDYSGFEYLHRMLFEMADALGSYQVYFVVTSLIIFSLFTSLAYLVGNQYSFLFALLCFVCLPTGYIDSVSIVRQYIAALSFLCLFFYSGRSYAVRLILLGVGALSHFSFLLVLPSLLAKRYIQKELSLGLHMSILIGMQGAVFIFKSSQVYSENPYLQYMASLDTSGFGFLVINIFIYAISSLFYFTQKQRDPGLTKVYNCYALGLSMYLALYQISVHAARFAYYFILIQPFLLGFMFYRVWWPVRVCLVLFCNAVFIAYLYVSNSNGIRDYLNEFSLRLY